MPLCTTLASREIFDAFSSPEKTDALLHGHSYTAHAVGCKVAEVSVKTMMNMEESGYWDGFKKSWATTAPSSSSDPNAVWSSWSAELVRDLSFAESVESIFAIGSVFSITLKDRSGGEGMLFLFLFFFFFYIFTFNSLYPPFFIELDSYGSINRLYIKRGERSTAEAHPGLKKRWRRARLQRPFARPRECSLSHGERDIETGIAQRH